MATWILQILLVCWIMHKKVVLYQSEHSLTFLFVSCWYCQQSEVLGVPASVETGFFDLDDNFYDKTSRIDFGPVASYDDMLVTANQLVDCRPVTIDADSYKACTHVILETWLADGEDLPAAIERPGNLGVLGEQNWFIPKFTAERDPTLLSYFGMSGDENRRKLAETFKRPTTWQEYCDEVSQDSCASDDGVAARPPADGSEGGSYFVYGNYTGYFRATAENDCDTYPGNCTGHFVDYPCHWNSYHLDIALESEGPDINNGYDYSQITQIWDAAAATKSDVMMMWWSPETTYERFQGTDAELTRVSLPPPTEECLAARVEGALKCGDNETVKQGDPAGTCDWPTLNLKKIITSTLHDASRVPQDSPALWNPAYDIISSFELSNIQYSNLFKRWFKGEVDGWSYDLRAATCEWVIDNFDLLEAFIPETYPRTVVEVDTSGSVWFLAAYIVCGVSILLVISSMMATFWHRNSKFMHYVQVEYMSTLLFGLVLVCTASLISIVHQTNTTCTVGPWFEGIGNTVVAVTLGIRVHAISKLNAAGKQMRHVRLRTRKLLLTVGAFVCISVALLTVWTAAGSPEKATVYTLSNKLTEFQEQVVYADYLCSTRTEQFELLSIGWQALVLVPAVMIVLITTSNFQDVNDTKALRVALIGRMFFMIFRFVGILVWKEHMLSNYLAFTCVMLGADSIVTLLVYVAPKFLKKTEVASSSMLPDVFLNTSVAVASIDGFTAWSSVREPIQVFQLLEVVFESFDEIAERHKIFKADTSANLFVTASGLPEARPDHAIAMARFASDCMKRMTYLTKKMETRFGPDTADLGLRVGIDSGAITGGYTFGKKESFQLFGDTMTTARLLHESGERGQILVSEKTANLIIKGGRKQWVSKLQEKILSSHKAEIQAYWLTRHTQHHGPGEGFSSNGSDDEDAFDDINQDSESRWIEWNTDTLRRQLQKVIARRSGTRRSGFGNSMFMQENLNIKTKDMPLEEVQEIIELPEFNKDAMRRLQERGDEHIELPEETLTQLHDFVAQVAGMYRKNHFHNFGHASYVVMAVTKYLNRINAAKELDVGFDADRLRSSTHAAMHDHTYGIASDPLTHFACVFSALIHDVDHPGVPNPQLIKENERLATIYKNRSVAEQRSFDLAWDLFMDPNFNLLRHALCPTEEELQRFRQLVINSVMATDLGDKVLKELRNNRWAAAFDEGAIDVNTKRGTNRKATIVIEHLIQAADIAHTCQHWYIYRKWNERLFRESYEAYRAGRAEKSPADYWYQGELGFFDFYIIPLSKKLRDCGVFGSTSDENLNYALNNRAMWERDGRSIVAEMLQTAEKSFLAVESTEGPGTSTLTTQSTRTAEEAV
eukprot:Nitzschia sp. Nitz4//scaffold381_size12975//22//4397//NITZ4_008988-RA/size12975-processed-gene-0.7-mRNA-1//-1//CDS//3329549898//5490//frame0